MKVDYDSEAHSILFEFGDFHHFEKGDYVELLGDAAQKNVIHGSKAVGEPPLMLAISAREAISASEVCESAARSDPVPKTSRPAVAVTTPPAISRRRPKR